MDYFNLVEGAFWILLGIVSTVVYFKVCEEYKRIAIFAAFILLTFGVSDLFQVAYGSFFLPGMEWLLIWKVVDVVGLCVVPFWYFVLRLKE